MNKFVLVLLIETLLMSSIEVRYITKGKKKSGINRVEDREISVVRTKIKNELRRKKPVVIRMYTCDRLLSQYFIFSLITNK